MKNRQEKGRQGREEGKWKHRTQQKGRKGK